MHPHPPAQSALVDLQAEGPDVCVEPQGGPRASRAASAHWVERTAWLPVDEGAAVLGLALEALSVRVQVVRMTAMAAEAAARLARLAD